MIVKIRFYDRFSFELPLEEEVDTKNTEITKELISNIFAFLDMQGKLPSNSGWCEILAELRAPDGYKYFMSIGRADSNGDNIRDIGDLRLANRIFWQGYTRESSSLDEDRKRGTSPLRSDPYRPLIKGGKYEG